MSDLQSVLLNMHVPFLPNTKRDRRHFLKQEKLKSTFGVLLQQFSRLQAVYWWFLKPWEKGLLLSPGEFKWALRLSHAFILLRTQRKFSIQNLSTQGVLFIICRFARTICQWHWMSKVLWKLFIFTVWGCEQLFTLLPVIVALYFNKKIKKKTAQ